MAYSAYQVVALRAGNVDNQCGERVLEALR